VIVVSFIEMICSNYYKFVKVNHRKSLIEIIVLNIGSKVYSHTRGSLLQNGKNRHFDDVGSKVSLVGAHLAPAVAIPVMLFSS
jgi:hypothetical protein